MHQPLGHFASHNLLPDCLWENYGKLNALQVWFTKNPDDVLKPKQKYAGNKQELGVACLLLLFLATVC